MDLKGTIKMISGMLQIQGKNKVKQGMVLKYAKLIVAKLYPEGMEEDEMRI